MKKATILLLPFLLLTFSSIATAEDNALLNIGNPYLRLSTGATAVTSADDSGWGGAAALMLSGGFDLNNLLGIQAGMNKAATPFIDIDNIYMSLVAQHALSERLTLAGKIGVSKSTITVDFIFDEFAVDNGVNAMIGAEMTYVISDNMKAALAFDHFGGELAVNSATVGIQYNF